MFIINDHINTPANVITYLEIFRGTPRFIETGVKNVHSENLFDSNLIEYVKRVQFSTKILNHDIL